MAAFISRMEVVANMSSMWGVLNLVAFLGLPILFYLVVSYYYPLWKEAFYGKQSEEVTEEEEVSEPKI